MGNPISDYFKDICPCCFGQGKVKAMQSYMTYDAGSVRGPVQFVMEPESQRIRYIKGNRIFKEDENAD